jgi:hypothetical protein
MFWPVPLSHRTRSRGLSQYCVLPLRTCPADTDLDVVRVLCAVFQPDSRVCPKGKGKAIPVTGLEGP